MTVQEKQPDCASRVNDSLESTLDDLRKLWDAYCSGEEDDDEDLGTFCEYGLSFDYVAAGTFDDQHNGYFRYQLSWGGPSEEFRFYADPEYIPNVIEFWFLDWFDGASVRLTGDDFTFMEEIFGFFKDIGSVEAEFEKATTG